MTGSQACTSSGVSARSMAGSPAWWESRKRTGSATLSARANSGQ